jgi:hypothetical protein
MDPEKREKLAARIKALAEDMLTTAEIVGDPEMYEASSAGISLESMLEDIQEFHDDCPRIEW